MPVLAGALGARYARLHDQFAAADARRLEEAARHCLSCPCRRLAPPGSSCRPAAGSHRYLPSVGRQ